jgi:peptidoglycan/xylan/chitin deacetylase (PgdA/CDA1 family)
MYTLVLTHDIDVLSLREVPWTSRTLWGFSWRCLRAALSLKGSLRSITERTRLVVWGLGMPLIKLGLLSDPWKESIHKMLQMERKFGVRSTLYFIPFPGKPGMTSSGFAAPPNRQSHYSLREYAGFIRQLESEGWEIGVHGIDAHWSLKAARDELSELEEILGHGGLGIRMHWLYLNEMSSWRLLDDAGYRYDATLGWNDRVGFPGDRFSPFSPIADSSFRVLPLNIQDGALLEHYSKSEEDAWKATTAILAQASQKNAVVTILWHNNSFVAPRNWGGLYQRILEKAIEDGAPIVRAIDVIQEKISIS